MALDCCKVQYPDLTEILYGRDAEEKDKLDIKTEFVFHLQARSKRKDHTFGNLGMRPVAQMNNWWPSHAGETRTMTLWWGRMPHSDGTPQVAQRIRWGGDKHKTLPRSDPYWKIFQHIAGSGCALKIGEPPLRKSLFHRFFTLMRMPVDVHPLQERWLSLHNYRHLDTGKLASYWVNGWPAEEYSSDKEYEYFKTTKQEWRITGRKGYPEYF